MKKIKTVIIGLSFIAAGAVIILANLGIIDIAIRSILLSWQMLLIVFGLLAFVGKNFKAGVIFVIVGAFFLLPLIPGLNLGEQFVRNFWPLMLVLVGVLILFTSRKKVAPNIEVEATFSEDGYINQSFLFNGSDQSFVGPVFKGGMISTIFGGTNLDLTNTNLPENQDAVLTLKGVCGGVTMKIPEGWRVEIKNYSFLGGVSDTRALKSAQNSTRKLIINAEYTLGGGDIK